MGSACTCLGYSSKCENQIIYNSIHDIPVAKITKAVHISSSVLSNTNYDLMNDNSLTIDHAKRVQVKKQSIGKLEKLCEKEVEVLKIISPTNDKLEDLEEIDISLMKHFFMRNFDRMKRIEIIKKMSLCYISKGDTLFKQKSVGTYMYIIQNGQVELYIEDEHIKSIKNWESFGELALLHNSARSGTIVASRNTYLWCLHSNVFKSIVTEFNNQNFEENKKFLNSVPILSNISDNFKSLLCLNLMKQQYDPGKVIVRDGDLANCIYIIKEGTVACSKNGVTVRELSKGDFFGDKSILIESKRSMDVIAKTSVVCFSISENTFRTVMGNCYRDIMCANYVSYALKKSKLLKDLNIHSTSKLFSAFRLKNYKKNDVVFPKNFPMNTTIAIVMEGNLKEKKGSTSNSTLGIKKGTILFEEFLLKDYTTEDTPKLGYDLIADPDCMIISASIKAIQSVIPGNFNFHDFLNKSKLISSLQQVPLFKNFISKKIEEIAECIKYEVFNDKEIIIREGESGSKFYIVKSGKVDIFVKSVYMRSLSEYDFFGEKSLVINETRSATAIASGDVVLYVLSKEDFQRITNEDGLREYLYKRIALQDDKAQLKDFDYVATLGKGYFGSVYLVSKRENNVQYALKAISKAQIEKDDIQSNLDLEKKILLQIDHPFIMKLVKTLKDERHIYFLMEYIEGKELFDVIREIGVLNKQQTIFYSASILLGIDYLHSRHILHRDIKPENVMITEKGYIKIIDFGTAIIIKDKTNTVIGTPQYMAPEVILGEGYAYSADFWSLGVCMYEFMCCGVPHGEGEEDPMVIYHSIVHDEPTFPKFIKDVEFRKLIKQMLMKNPLKRLCSFEAIKNHEWFKNFDWDSLCNLNYNIPYVPKITKNKFNNNNLENFVDFIVKNERIIKIPQKKNSTDSRLKIEEWYEQF